ncbi:hypothetical protein ACC692_37160, partial [Rhizobium ruizarguesonis]
RSVLQDEGIRTAVVSMPCRLLFDKQDAAYKKSVLGGSRARVAVEAAVQDSWDRYLGIGWRDRAISAACRGASMIASQHSAVSIG